MKLALSLLLLLAGAPPAPAEVAILLEQPYGWFGSFNPTGHAAVYLSNVCAESPTRLRRCEPGENGVVISRYRALAGRDWIAVPVVAFFYGVGDARDLPAAPDRAAVQALRETWRRQHLAEIAPDRADGKAPRGDWVQLIGVAYDRSTYAFQLPTTEAQDDRLIAELNSRPNRQQFHLLMHNCADFAREILNRYYPGAVSRSFLADGGITTPKQVARSFVRYGHRHSDLELTSFSVPQIGAMGRGKPCRGVFESFVRSKRYIVPLAFFHPWLAGGLGVAYLTRGRFDPARTSAKLHSAAPEWVRHAAEARAARYDGSGGHGANRSTAAAADPDPPAAQ